MQRSNIGMFVFFAVFVVLIVLGASLAGTKDVARVNRLMNEGRVAEGRVYNLRVLSGKSTSYEVGYSFRADGRQMGDISKIPEYVYDSLREGGSVSITYLPGNPAEHMVGIVDESRVDSTKKMYASLAVLFSVPLVLLIVGMGGLTWYEWNALANYQATGGVIFSLGPPLKGKQAGQRKITVRYSNLDGETREVARQVNLNQFKDLAEGQPTTVLMHPTKRKSYLLLNAISTVEPA